MLLTFSVPRKGVLKTTMDVASDVDSQVIGTITVKEEPPDECYYTTVPTAHPDDAILPLSGIIEIKPKTMAPSTTDVQVVGGSDLTPDINPNSNILMAPSTTDVLVVGGSDLTPDINPNSNISLQCTECGYSTKRNSDMLTHCASHQQPATACITVNAPTSASMEPPPSKRLRTYTMIDIVHGRKYYRCINLTCNQWSFEENQLKEHILTAHIMEKQSRYFTCIICMPTGAEKATSKQGVIVRSFEQMKEHFLTSHENHVENFLNCINMLSSHVNALHLPKTVSEAYRYAGVVAHDTVSNHIKGGRLLIDPNGKTKVYQCALCNFQHITEEVARQHLILSHFSTMQVFSCSNCLFGCPDRKSFENHFNEKHPNKELDFAFNSSLLAHLDVCVCKNLVKRCVSVSDINGSLVNNALPEVPEHFYEKNSENAQAESRSLVDMLNTQAPGSLSLQTKNVKDLLKLDHQYCNKSSILAAADKFLRIQPAPVITIPVQSNIPATSTTQSNIQSTALTNSSLPYFGQKPIIIGQPQQWQQQSPIIIGQSQQPLVAGQIQSQLLGQPQTIVLGQSQPPIVIGQQQPSIVIGQNQQPIIIRQSQSHPPIIIGQPQPQIVIGQSQQPIVIGSSQQPIVIGQQQQQPIIIGQHQPQIMFSQQQLQGQPNIHFTLGQANTVITNTQANSQLTLGQASPQTGNSQLSQPLYLIQPPPVTTGLTTNQISSLSTQSKGLVLKPSQPSDPPQSQQPIAIGSSQQSIITRSMPNTVLFSKSIDQSGNIGNPMTPQITNLLIGQTDNTVKIMSPDALTASVQGGFTGKSKFVTIKPKGLTELKRLIEPSSASSSPLGEPDDVENDEKYEKDEKDTTYKPPINVKTEESPGVRRYSLRSRTKKEPEDKPKLKATEPVHVEKEQVKKQALRQRKLEPRSSKVEAAAEPKHEVNPEQLQPVIENKPQVFTIYRYVDKEQVKQQVLTKKTFEPIITPKLAQIRQVAVEPVPVLVKEEEVKNKQGRPGLKPSWVDNKSGDQKTSEPDITLSVFMLYMCLYCGNLDMDLSLMCEHFRTKHKNSFVCPVCKCFFVAKGGSDAFHLNCMMLGKGIDTCFQESYMTFMYKNFKAGGLALNRWGTKGYKCDCGYTHLFDFFMKRHVMLTHCAHLPPVYKCPHKVPEVDGVTQCSFGSMDFAEFQNHAKFNHPNVGFDTDVNMEALGRRDKLMKSIARKMDISCKEALQEICNNSEQSMASVESDTLKEHNYNMACEVMKHRYIGVDKCMTIVKNCKIPEDLLQQLIIKLVQEENDISMGRVPKPTEENPPKTRNIFQFKPYSLEQSDLCQREDLPDMVICRYEGCGLAGMRKQIHSHILDKHYKGPVAFTCHHCEFSENDIEVFNTHMLTKHPGNKMDFKMDHQALLDMGKFVANLTSNISNTRDQHSVSHTQSVSENSFESGIIQVDSNTAQSQIGMVPVHTEQQFGMVPAQAEQQFGVVSAQAEQQFGIVPAQAEQQPQDTEKPMFLITNVVSGYDPIGTPHIQANNSVLGGNTFISPVPCASTSGDSSNLGTTIVNMEPTDNTKAEETTGAIEDRCIQDAEDNVTEDVLMFDTDVLSSLRRTLGQQQDDDEDNSDVLSSLRLTLGKQGEEDECMDEIDDANVTLVDGNSVFPIQKTLEDSGLFTEDGPAHWKHACTLCDVVKSHRNSIHKHILEVHVGINPFQCPYCPMSVSHSDLIFKHVKLKHPRKPVKVLMNSHKIELVREKIETLVSSQQLSHDMYVCRLCAFILDNMEDAADHMEQVHVTRQLYPYKCDQCRVKVLTESDMHKHYVAKHGTKLADVDKLKNESLVAKIKDEIDCLIRNCVEKKVLNEAPVQ